MYIRFTKMNILASVVKTFVEDSGIILNHEIDSRKFYNSIYDKVQFQGSLRDVKEHLEKMRETKIVPTIAVIDIIAYMIAEVSINVEFNQNSDTTKSFIVMSKEDTEKVCKKIEDRKNELVREHIETIRTALVKSKFKFDDEAVMCAKQLVGIEDIKGHNLCNIIEFFNIGRKVDFQYRDFGNSNRYYESILDIIKTHATNVSKESTIFVIWKDIDPVE